MEARFESNFSEVFKELHNTSSIDAKTILALESVLIALYQATQRHVHVITGQLKRSGKTNSHVINDTWTGEIVYSGPAIYELARGGEHDFFSVARELDSAFLAAVRTQGD